MVYILENWNEVIWNSVTEISDGVVYEYESIVWSDDSHIVPKDRSILDIIYIYIIIFYFNLQFLKFKHHFWTTSNILYLLFYHAVFHRFLVAYVFTLNKDTSLVSYFFFSFVSPYRPPTYLTRTKEKITKQDLKWYKKQE
jgi:hypothetical protein